MHVGVLALQGAFDAHVRSFEACGVTASLVRKPRDLEGADALAMPGGESTTMFRLLVTSGLKDPLAKLLRNNMPVFGTCAGMILLGSSHLRAIDIDVDRNAYGRQIDSFETDIDFLGLGEPFHAMFVRAPKVTRVGKGVEVLASHEGDVVACASGSVLVSAFHPELTADTRIHQWFLDRVRAH